ncbi:tryptophan-rich sensory protein [Bacillus tianshenii]|nr:tryptophan-rich sensory protein [Bacillus tianshenii]
MKLRLILLFVVIYGLYTISGFLFPVDRDWYDALNKPAWTPSGSTIGIIWGILFACIALAGALVYQKEKFSKQVQTFWAVLSFNYIVNQLFIFFQFEMKDLLLATIDCVLVALSALLLIFLAKKHSRVASFLFVPYFLWASFATVLSYLIYTMNN